MLLIRAAATDYFIINYIKIDNHFACEMSNKNTFLWQFLKAQDDVFI